MNIVMALHPRIFQSITYNLLIINLPLLPYFKVTYILLFLSLASIKAIYHIIQIFIGNLFDSIFRHINLQPLIKI